MSPNKENKIKVTTNEHNEAVITGTLSVEALNAHRPAALRFFSENLTLDGFRKGNIPESVIKKNVSETAILEETASRALNEMYPEIIQEEKLDVFGRPQVSFTKLAPDNPVEFTITTPLMPKIEIADYKKIAKELNASKPEVTLEEEEVSRALLEVRKELDRRESKTKEEEAVGENTNDKKQKVEPEPSELTDEKVQKISSMKTVLEFEQSVREDLKKHKENQAEEKHRLAIMEKILEKSVITLPKAIIESELQSMMAQFASDVSATGLTMEDYLKQAGKTKEELLKEWRPHAENRAKMQLLLNRMATNEKLLPKKEDIDHHVSHLLEHNPTADKERAEIYVETQLANANVFSFLEKQK
jgi:FKBP-type peptidyl-prolyl cis-trans isomerase (trigger factor)